MENYLSISNELKLGLDSFLLSETDEKGTYERLKITKKEDMDKFWGVFSIEGGKKDNMEYIVTVLKHIVYHLEQEYTPNNDIYLGFITLYDKVNNYRNKIQNVAEKIISIRKIQLEIKEKLQKFESNLIRKKNDLEQLVSENKKKISNYFIKFMTIS